MNNPIIILGSSRSRGNTWQAIQTVYEEKIRLIDLNDYNILPFDYEHKNKHDDFLTLMEEIMNYDTFILATPIYWYTMSGQMKVFLDRFTDLLKIRQDLGKKLRGKNLFVLACFGTSPPKNLEAIFQEICRYLGMNFKGVCFIYSGQNSELLTNNFQQIEEAKQMLKL
ncbi:MAG: NAD(P)H-dependent oxidoreductase [Sphingobacteriia bacterium]|nr:NAD(P)H-dependent oxidoreductase [Sphingobacteriia bacterium]